MMTQLRIFLGWGLPFPNALLGYRPPNSCLGQPHTIEVQPRSAKGDIIADYLDATAAHLCPVDYLTHTLLPAVLRQAGFTTITLDPSPGYMNPTYWDDITALITGLTAFIAAEEEMRSLFHGRSANLWEMAETLAEYRCEFIVIKRGEGGQLLYDSATHSRWEIPAYAARVNDPTGAGDAFLWRFLGLDIAGPMTPYKPYYMGISPLRSQWKVTAFFMPWMPYQG
jgi:sugar/nucleoside kinase (ribokinase family)